MGFIQLLCSKEITFWAFRKQSFFQNKALKCTSHFHWLICPKLVWSCPVGYFYNVCFGGVSSQAADMAWYQATKPNQYMSLLLAAAWKRVCSVLWWRLKWGQISLLHRDYPISRHAPHQHLVRACGNFCTFWIGFILFILFYLYFLFVLFYFYFSNHKISSLHDLHRSQSCDQKHALKAKNKFQNFVAASSLYFLNYVIIHTHNRFGLVSLFLVAYQPL